MEFKSQQGAPRPQPQVTDQPTVINEPVSKPVQAGDMKSNQNGVAGKIIGAFVAVVLVAAVAFGVWKFTQSGNSGDTTVDTKAYQAVFLTNGQVYFGKLKSLEGEYITLTNIYYLQVQQSVQPKADDASDDSKVSLNKLGNELHGPTDEMNISKDQVLFWENMKSDSTVTQAIVKNEGSN